MPNPSQALPADELTPIYFAVCHDKTLKIGTMKTYLAGVWNLHILNGFVLPPKQFMHLGKRLTRQCLTSELIGTYNSPWSSGPQFFLLCRHSFRVRAATSVAAVGLPSWLIKTLGRWTSDCVATYISTPVSVLCQAAHKLRTPIKRIAQFLKNAQTQ